MSKLNQLALMRDIEDALTKYFGYIGFDIDNADEAEQAKWGEEFSGYILSKVTYAPKTLGEEMDLFKADLGEEKHEELKSNPAYKEFFDEWREKKIEENTLSVKNAILERLPEGAEFSNKEVELVLLAMSGQLG